MNLVKLRRVIEKYLIKLLMNFKKRDPAYLRRETLIGSIVEQELDDLIVILLCSHVQRSESILRLDVDRGPVLNKYIDYFGLAS